MDERRQIKLYTCYIKALLSNHPTPATRGTFDIWRKRNPDKHPMMNPNTLNTARRYAEQHTLTAREMENIRKAEEGRINPPMTANPQPNDEIPPEINHTTTGNITSLNLETQPPTETREITHTNTLDHLIIMYETFKYTKLNERMRPKKFHLTKKNKIKINKMNTTLTDFLHTQTNLSITDLNTLHYTAAVILARTIKPQPPTNKNRQDPNQRTKTK